MVTSPELDPTNLPADALPFLRELLLEIIRRLPPDLGTPPRFDQGDLEDQERCANAAKTLVQWFDGVPDALGQRMEELEQVFHSLLQIVQDIDSRVHRAVIEARSRAEEESTFVHSLSEVLGTVRDRFQQEDLQGAEQIIDQVLHRIDSRQQNGGRGCLRVSALFDQVQLDLDQLRNDIAQVETKTHELRQQSLRDTLTGLWNRRACDQRLAEELARSVRYRFPLSIALWDIDNLKSVNDIHGHPIGDLTLQTLSTRTLGMLRRSDFLARVGGAQFAVIFPNTPAHQAGIAGEKIRRLVEDQPVQTPAGPVSLTASVGIAALCSGDSADTLFQRADQALLHAKSLGRNRVCESTQTQSPELLVKEGGGTSTPTAPGKAIG